MRRRQRFSDTNVTTQLLTYDPADWPNGCHPECAFWDAVHAYLDANPESDWFEQRRGPMPDAPFHPELL